MSQLVVSTAEPNRTPLITRYHYALRPLVAALLVSTSYYLGAKIGFLLTFSPHPVSTLWPPNSILFAALLLLPLRWWWLILLAAFPAHLATQLNADIPLTMILCWFVSNCSEALIGASLLRYLTKNQVRFDSTYNVGMFLLVALLGPFLSSFLDSAFVVLNQFGTSSYWDVFRMRFFSNTLASLTLVPFIVTWTRGGIASIRNAPPKRYLEAALLAAGLLIVGLVSFGARDIVANNTPALLYLPLPLLLWSAIRFGPEGLSASLLVVSLFAIW